MNEMWHLSVVGEVNDVVALVQRSVRSERNPVKTTESTRIARRMIVSAARPMHGPRQQSVRVQCAFPAVEYHISQYELEQGALEIQYIEEFFGEFPRKKTAAEIVRRLSGRAHLILLANASLPDDRGTIVPV